MKNKKLNIFLWVLQGLLCAMFFMAGYMKLFSPLAEVAKSLHWVKDTPPLSVRSLGLTDLLGAIGIVLPLAIHKLPKLTLWAAAGLVLSMVSAIIFHVSRGEASLIGINIALLIMAIIVFWGRSKTLSAS